MQEHSPLTSLHCTAGLGGGGHGKILPNEMFKRILSFLMTLEPHRDTLEIFGLIDWHCKWEKNDHSYLYTFVYILLFTMSSLAAVPLIHGVLWLPCYPLTM